MRDKDANITGHVLLAEFKIRTFRTSVPFDALDCATSLVALELKVQLM
jgi:hypothetical protein